MATALRLERFYRFRCVYLWRGGGKRGATTATFCPLSGILFMHRTGHVYILSKSPFNSYPSSACSGPLS